MDQHKKIITTQIIEDVVNKTSADRVPIRDLIGAMDAAGFGFTMMIFAFGVLIPLPPPVPSIIAFPLLIFSLQMLMGHKAPALPKRFAKISVKRSILAMLVQRSSPYIRKIERILRPRLTFMFLPLAERIVGFFLLIFSFSIVMPIPFSNFVPGLGVLVVSFGLLGKDGLMVILGIIIGIIGCTITTMAVILGAGAINYLKNLLF